MGPRTCPHCLNPIPVESGFYFDENLNLVHTECGKFIFSTTSETDCAAASFAHNRHAGRYDYRQYWDGRIGGQSFQQLTYQPHQV